MLVFPHFAAGNLDVMARILEIILDHGGKAHNLGMMEELSKGTRGH